MNKNECIKKVREITKGYTVFYVYTGLPYLECEKENFYDQAYLFDTFEEADEMCKKYFENKLCLTIQELTVKDTVVADMNGDVKPTKINQIRHYLYMLRQLGANAICYKPEGEEAMTLPLADILPRELGKPMEPEIEKMTQVQLTGIYLAQEMRRDPKEPNVELLIELTNEYYSNLVNSDILMPIKVPEEKKDEKYLNLGECQLPYIRMKDKVFLAVFTDPREVESYVLGQDFRVVPIPFADIEKICPEAVVGCMVNPKGFALPLNKEDFRKIIEKHKK